MEEDKNKEELARKALGIDEDKDSINTESYIIPEEKKEKKDTSFIDSVGYIPITNESLPSKYKFYKDNVVVRIRAANVSEVKHYSSMDEDDVFSAEAHVASILESCSTISDGHQLYSHKDLCEFDKLYIFFAIRDRTLLVDKREHEINIQSECSNCGDKKQLKISNETFGYLDIPKSFGEYYSTKEKCYVFSDKILGSEPLKIYIPTIGSIEAITSYIKDKEMEKQSGNGGYYNATNVSILMYITPDWRMFDKEEKYIKSKLKEIEEEWNTDKYTLATECINRIKSAIKPTITYKCEKCGKEVVAQIRFQGFRTIFASKSTVSKFFKESE